MKNLIFIKIENQEAASESGRAARVGGAALFQRDFALKRHIWPPQSKTAQKLQSSTIYFYFRAPLAFYLRAVGRRGFFAFGQPQGINCPNAKKPLQPTARGQKARGARKWKIQIFETFFRSIFLFFMIFINFINF